MLKFTVNYTGNRV